MSKVGESLSVRPQVRALAMRWVTVNVASHFVTVVMRGFNVRQTETLAQPSAVAERPKEVGLSALHL